MAHEFEGVEFSAQTFGDRRYPTTVDELVDGYIAYFDRDEIPGDGEDPLWWASAASMELVDQNPDLALEFVLRVLTKRPAPRVAGMLSAGLLEDILGYHGEQFIARVELEARRDPAFRALLSGVWRHGMSEAIWARVQHAAGVL